MSSPQRWPVTEQLVLRCDRCPAAWASEVYDVGTFDDVRAWRQTEDAGALAFALGWRVFVGRSTQHTYCPQHGPTVPMRQVHPKEIR